MYGGPVSADKEEIPVHPIWNFAFYVESGITTEQADSLLAMMPGTIMRSATMISIGYSNGACADDYIIYDRGSLQQPQLSLVYGATLGNASATLLAKVVSGEEGSGTYYDGSNVLQPVITIENGVVTYEVESKLRPSLICNIAVWLAGTLVCGALSFWNFWVALVCSFIHMLIDHYGC
jgi:hypothetical protein